MKKIIGLLLSLSIMTSYATSVFADNPEKEHIKIYVAVDGNDANSGTEDAPLATISAARDMLREMKKSGKDTAGATVLLRGGNYRMNTNIVFTDEDSGTESEPIIYTAYPGEEVLFVGGVQIPSSEFKELTDEKMIKKASSEAVAGKIVQYDLKKAGITEIEEQKWIGTYSYTDEGKMIHGKTKGNGSPEIFVNGEAMTLARFPNDRTMSIKKVVVAGERIEYYSDEKINTSGYIKPEDRKGTPFTIVPSEGDIARWGNAENALIYGKFGNSWADQTVPLKSVDLENGTITSMYPSQFGCREGQPIYIYNLFEELDVPGEYYIDEEKAILYLYPPENLKKYEVGVSTLNSSMIEAKNAKNILFNGISVTCTKGRAYYFNNCENVIIQNADIGLTATMAVYMLNCKKSGIRNCHIHDVDGAVMLEGGDFENLTPSENFVRNCHIERFARITKTYTTAIRLYGVGDEATYNKMNGAEHVALMFNGNDNLIAYNEIYDCCTNSDDMGTIYAGRNITVRGNMVLFNYIHDIASTAADNLGVHGVYFDDGLSGNVAVGNVFENITGYGVHMTGRDTSIKNNVFVNVKKGIAYMDYRDGSAENSIGGELRNRLTWVPYQNEAWQKAYPGLKDPERYLNDKNFNANNEVSDNLCINSNRMEINSSVSEWGEAKNNYFGSVDVGFYDMENRNYTLKKDAKAYSLIENFQPIPFTRIGNCDKRALARVNDAVVLKIGSNYAYLDGEMSAIDENIEVKPQIINNLTFVPLRFISEGLGADVEWDAETKTAVIQKGQDSISFTIDKETATVNGEEINIGASAFISNGRTYVPLRAASEALGEKVFWDNSGFIAISSTENLFDSKLDKEIIEYLSSNMLSY